MGKRGAGQVLVGRAHAGLDRANPRAVDAESVNRFTAMQRASSNSALCNADCRYPCFVNNAKPPLPPLRERFDRWSGSTKLPDIVRRWRTGSQRVIRAREWLSDPELRALVTPTHAFDGSSEAVAAPRSPDALPVYVDLGGIASSARLPFGVFVGPVTSGVQTALDMGPSLICVDWQVPCSMPELSMAVAQALLDCGAFRYAAPEEAGEIALPVLRALLAAQQCVLRALAEPAAATV